MSKTGTGRIRWMAGDCPDNERALADQLVTGNWPSNARLSTCRRGIDRDCQVPNAPHLLVWTSFAVGLMFMKRKIRQHGIRISIAIWIWYKNILRYCNFLQLETRSYFVHEKGIIVKRKIIYEVLTSECEVIKSLMINLESYLTYSNYSNSLRVCVECSITL